MVESKGDQPENLWQSILNKVSQKDDVGDSHLLILGDSQVGKRSLIQQMHKTCVKSKNKFIDVDSMGSSYSSVDASYLYVRDLSDKDAGGFVGAEEASSNKLNIWTVRDPARIKLLNRMLKPEDLNNLVALVLADFSEPWELMNSLQKWSTALRELI